MYWQCFKIVYSAYQLMRQQNYDVKESTTKVFKSNKYM